MVNAQETESQNSGKEKYYVDSDKFILIDSPFPYTTTFSAMVNSVPWAKVESDGKVVLLDLEKAKEVEKEGLDYNYFIARLVLAAYEMGKQERS